MLKSKELLMMFKEEALITFNNKAYPKFGNIVLMAGGGGSGKGFTLQKLLGIEGKVIDVDALKSFSMRLPLIIKKVKTELGVDLVSLNLKNPYHVSQLHTILSDEIKLDKRYVDILIQSIYQSDKTRLPNIIFDKTMKSKGQLKQVSDFAKLLGYDLKNVHIVWVVNDIEKAIEQNNSRDRTIPKDILVDTHEGVSSMMNFIIHQIPEDIRNYIDGDIIINFNKSGEDIEMLKSSFGGAFISSANYVKIKESGKNIDINKITKNVFERIKKYVPNKEIWNT